MGTTSADQRKLRGHRVRLGEPQLGDIVATFHHGELGNVAANVEDVAAHGLALVVHRGADQAPLILTGDPLEGLAVDGLGARFYRGRGLVRRATPRGLDLVLGVELESRGIDVAEIFRRGARKTFSERWRATHQTSYGHLSADFKAWVADLRAYLEMTQRFLRAEEQALAGADLLTRQETSLQYLDEIQAEFFDRMSSAGVELASLVGHLSDAEHADYRAFCRMQLSALFVESPFMRRAAEKPLGYAGDYEMMNMLYRDHAEGETLFGRLLNLYGTHEIAARANINRIEFLGDLIQRAVARTPEGRTRIASIGCGPAHEIRSLLEAQPVLGPRLEVALVDQEERSIAYCQRTLMPLATRTGVRIQFIRESVRRLLSARRLSETLGERELIYSAGLFDYMNDRSFSALLSVLYGALAPGGLLAVGNVAIQNPSRWAMEYFSEWFLIHRSREDLVRLAQSLSPTPLRTETAAEPLGVNLFLMVTK